MLLTVHDELVLEVPADERERTEALVREVMEHVTELRVPLAVDIGFGPNWARRSRPPSRRTADVVVVVASEHVSLRCHIHTSR